MDKIINQQAYPAEVLRLNDPLEFVKIFQDQLKKTEFAQDAYEQVEAQYIRLFGRRKYANYMSFRFCIKNKYNIYVTNV
jgi:hypothetical protein